MDKEQSAPLVEFCKIMQRILHTYRRLPGQGAQDMLLLCLIKHLWKSIAARWNDKLQEQGLTPVGFFTLLMLYSEAERGVNPSELSQWVGETRTNMTRVCAELEKRGLLTRSPCCDDRRRVEVLLSVQGAELVAELLPMMRASVLPKLDVLDEAEQQSLHHLLLKLLEGQQTG